MQRVVDYFTVMSLTKAENLSAVQKKKYKNLLRLYCVSNIRSTSKLIVVYFNSDKFGATVRKQIQFRPCLLKEVMELAGTIQPRSENVIRNCELLETVSKKYN